MLEYLKESTGGAGVSVKQLSLDVYRSGSTSSLGTLTGNFRTGLFLGAATPKIYLGKGRLAYDIRFGISNFTMKTQEVGSSDVKLGTGASGFYSYLMPMLLCDFSRGADGEEGKSGFIAGFGVGAGYLEVKGDILLTAYPGRPRHEFDIKSLTPAYGLLFGYRYGRLETSFTLAGPEATKGDLEYDLFDASMNFSYRFGGRVSGPRGI